MELCRYLRWKGLYALDVVTEEQLLAELDTNEATCTCLRTFQPWGPDDGPATIDGCDSARRCFLAAPVGKKQV